MWCSKETRSDKGSSPDNLSGISQSRRQCGHGETGARGREPPCACGHGCVRWASAAAAELAAGAAEKASQLSNRTHKKGAHLLRVLNGGAAHRRQVGGGGQVVNDGVQQRLHTQGDV